MERWTNAMERGDKEEAVRILIEEAEKQNQKAMYMCGCGMALGVEPFSVNIEEGEKWLLKLSELDGKDYSYELGIGYGKLDEQTKAVEYFEKAVKNGKREACGDLAVQYYTLKRYNEAYRYAEMSDDWKGAMVLGFLYDNGEGVEHSRSKAHEYYSLAVKKGCTVEAVMDRANITYYGSATQGRYIIKRLLIAITGVVIFYLLAAFLQAGSM